MARHTSTVRTTTVGVIAKPMGKARENGPHLADLRAFVAECEGLPDSLLVRITDGHLDESGRRNVMIETVLREPLIEEDA